MRKVFFYRFDELLRRCVTSIKILILTAIFSILIACQNQPLTNQTGSIQSAQISDGFYQLGSDKPIKLKVPLTEIRRATESPKFSLSPIEKYNGTRRRFINEQLNSRSPIVLNDGEWKIKWQADLPAGFSPLAILEANERILIESDGVWFLFDKEGKKLLNGQLGASGIILDNENFYAADSSGLIWARSLADGKNIFGLSLYFGNVYQRIFMFRQGQKFLAFSTERDLEADTPKFKDNTLIEAIELGNPIKIDSDKLLQSAQPLAHLIRKTNTLLTAANNQMLVFATQNRIYLADLNLEIQKAFSGDFVPQTMSLDETGRIYLTVKKENRSFLWLIFPNGELAMEFELPRSFVQNSTPPIIGYKNNIYLLGKNKILVVNLEGKLLWENDLEKNIGGAIVTANDQLLVSVKNEVLAFDINGQKRNIVSLTDEPITVAPLLTKGGEILVASKNRLYCLHLP